MNVERSKPFERLVYTLTGILVIALAFLFPAVIRFEIGLEYPLYEKGELFFAAFGIMLVFVIAGSIIAKNDKSLTRVIIFFTGPLLLPWICYGLYQANIRLDNSAAEIFVTEISDKHKHARLNHIKGDMPSQTVEIKDWRDPAKTFNLHTNHLFYNNVRTKAGNHIRLTTHTGFLGYEWIENYEVVEGKATNTTP